MALGFWPMGTRRVELCHLDSIHPAHTSVGAISVSNWVVVGWPTGRYSTRANELEEAAVSQSDRQLVLRMIGVCVEVTVLYQIIHLVRRLILKGLLCQNGCRVVDAPNTRPWLTLGGFRLGEAQMWDNLFWKRVRQAIWQIFINFG